MTEPVHALTSNETVSFSFGPRNEAAARAYATRTHNNGGT